jgi:16S rRNA (uracil1498-N3)-methyltransferase
LTFLVSLPAWFLNGSQKMFFYRFPGVTRLDSFFLPPQAWSPPFRLEGDEARHLAKVLRLKPGAIIRCFDGAGREGDFRVSAVKNAVELEALQIRELARPSPQTWLGLGWNKSTRRGWLLEKAVELGAAGIIFWRAEHSQGSMPDAPKESWQAQLVAGAKQCHNPWLPELRMAAKGLSGLLDMADNFKERWLLWESPEVARGLDMADLSGPGNRLFVLGPEGGLSQEEAERLQDSGFTAVTLGPRALRWETAALLCLGLAWWAGLEVKCRP